MCKVFELLGIMRKQESVKPPAENQLTGAQVFDLVKHAQDHVYIWDSAYYAYSLEDWQSVIKSVRAGLPAYLVDKFDCEDFAMLVMARVIERYQVNSMGVAVGNSPLGYHGFNVFVAVENGQPKLHVLEPQTGEIDPAGYELDTVIFG